MNSWLVSISVLTQRNRPADYVTRTGTCVHIPGGHVRTLSRFADPTSHHRSFQNSSLPAALKRRTLGVRTVLRRVFVGTFALFGSGVPAPTDVALAKGGVSSLVRCSKLVRASKSIANSHTDCPSQRTSTISRCPATCPTSAISQPSGSIMILSTAREASR